MLGKVPRTGGCRTRLTVPGWRTHPRHRFAFGFARGSYFQALVSGCEVRNRLLLCILFFKKVVAFSSLLTSTEVEFWERGDRDGGSLTVRRFVTKKGRIAFAEKTA